MSDFWILGPDHIPRPASIREFSEQSPDARRVALDIIERVDADPVKVSTVFLGLDHNWSGSGPPVLFESMVFGGPLDEHQVRYCTWDEAVRGHAHLLAESLTEGEMLAWQARQAIEAAKGKP